MLTVAAITLQALSLGTPGQSPGGNQGQFEMRLDPPVVTLVPSPSSGEYESPPVSVSVACPSPHWRLDCFADRLTGPQKVNDPKALTLLPAPAAVVPGTRFFGEPQPLNGVSFVAEGGPIPMLRIGAFALRAKLDPFTMPGRYTTTLRFRAVMPGWPASVEVGLLPVSIEVAPYTRLSVSGETLLLNAASPGGVVAARPVTVTVATNQAAVTLTADLGALTSGKETFPADRLCIGAGRTSAEALQAVKATPLGTRRVTLSAPRGVTSWQFLARADVPLSVPAGSYTGKVLFTLGGGL